MTIKAHYGRMTKKEELETLSYLESEQPVAFVRCRDCRHWQIPANQPGRCIQGRPLALPPQAPRLCG